MIDVEEFVRFTEKDDASSVQRNREKLKLQFKETDNEIERNHKKTKKKDRQNK